MLQFNGMKNEKYEIVKIPVGQMQANCYLVIEKGSKKTLIIDPGDAPDYIKTVITKEKLIPEIIVATHGHFDHIMGVLDLQLTLKIPFLAHSKDEFLIERMGETTKHFLSYDGGPSPKPTMHIKNGHVIYVGSASFTVIETPGHTPGSVCLYDASSDILFTGDTLFASGGVGRTDFSYSSKSLLQKSVKKILSLPPKTTILTGHGDTSTIEAEKPFHRALN